MTKENFKPFFVKEKKMKKLIALMFAVLFLGAGIATASDLSMTGSYYVRGQYYDGVTYDMNPLHDKSYAYYDHELSVDTKWKMDDTTFVTARFEMRDENWGGANSPVENGSPATQTATFDDNIIVEQVWGQTTFANGILLQVGLMPAGAWGTSFASTSAEAYRIKTHIPTSIGTVIGILERGHAANNNLQASAGATGSSEQGNSTWGEDEDDDIYHLALVTKVGDVFIKPLLTYKNLQSNTAMMDIDQFAAQLTLEGTMGKLGWETDFMYVNTDTGADTISKDFDLFGAYGNVWYQIDAFKVGGFVAYGSYDKDAQVSFDMGDDFAPGGLLIIGDDLFDIEDGNPLTTQQHMGAGTLFGLYGEYAVNDKLSLSAVAAFATVNREGATAGTTLAAWDDADIFELSGGFVYKITPSLTYDGGIGMATVEFGDNTVDPDTIVEAFHRLSFAF
nr:hypothetical protein [Desulfobacula sp.]